MSPPEEFENPGLVRAYRFVPLPDSKVKRQEPPGHHRYRPGSYTGELRATLFAHGPIHVASGLLERSGDRKHPLVRAHFRTGGTLAIPGSSLKGCVRSVAEALTSSFIQITRAREIDRALLPPRQPDQLDVVQRIFGAFGYQGMLNFADAPITPADARPEIWLGPQLFAPRPQATGTYFEGQRPRGRKVYIHGPLIGGKMPMEVCPAGSSFALTLRFAGLTAAELGLVLVALGQSDKIEERFFLKLGGGKPAGLGGVELRDPTISALQSAAAYADYDAVPAPLTIDVLVQAARAAGLFLPRQLERYLGAIEE